MRFWETIEIDCALFRVVMKSTKNYVEHAAVVTEDNCMVYEFARKLMSWIIRI